MDIRARDIVTTMGEHRAPEKATVFWVKLDHKPTRISAEGSGATFDEAKAEAVQRLTEQLDAIEAEESVMEGLR